MRGNARLLARLSCAALLAGTGVLAGCTGSHPPRARAASTTSGRPSPAPGSSARSAAQARPFEPFDLAFASRSTGWLLGAPVPENSPPTRSEIWHTTTAGDSWSVQWRGPGTPLSMSAADRSHAWALVGCAGPPSCRPWLIGSADAGRTWRRLSTLPAAVRRVQFYSPRLGLASANRDCPASARVRRCPGRLLVTHDGGRRWVTALTARYPLYGAAGPDGRVWAAEAVFGFSNQPQSPGLQFFGRDRGGRWRTLGPPANPGNQIEWLIGETAVELFADRHGPVWVDVGTDGCGMHGGCTWGPFHSPDGGRTWTALHPPPELNCPVRVTVSLTLDGTAWTGYTGDAAACAPPFGPLARYTATTVTDLPPWQLASVSRLAGIDGATAFAIGQGSGGAFLARTDDGGRRWTQLLPAEAPTGALTPISTTLAFGARDAVDAGAVVATTDAGATWRRVAHLPGVITQLAFPTARDGFAVTVAIAPSRPNRWRLWRSTDAGRTWTSLGAPPLPRGARRDGNAGVYAFAMTADGHGLVVDAGGMLPADGQSAGATAPVRFYTSTDGGVTWALAHRLPNAAAELGAVSFAWTGRQWAGWLVHDAGGGQRIEATADTGRSATPLDVPTVSDVQLLGQCVGFAWDEQGEAQPSLVLYRSSDAGRHWNRSTAPLDPTALAFVDARHGWLLTQTATWHTADAGRTWQRR